MRLKAPQKQNGMYLLSKDQIEDIATEIIAHYYPENLIHSAPLDTMHFMQEVLGLSVRRANIGAFGSGIMGLTVFGDEVEIPSYDEMYQPIVLKETFGTVLISKDLFHADNLPRQHYTEAHEAAHFILHRDYYKIALATFANRTANTFQFIACREIGKPIASPKNDHQWLEWQADHLAAALLMPKEIFQNFARSVMQNKGISAGYIADGYTSRRQIEEVTSAVAERFFVSRQAAQIRMSHLGLIQKPNFNLL